MKFTAILAFIAAATVVSASTNAERMARGLPPNAPMKRASPVERARRGYPSEYPHHKCNTGSIQCCKQTEKAGHGHKIDDLLKLAGFAVVFDQLAGANCSPISVIGGGGSHCDGQTVCCSHVHQNGLVSSGCAPVDINA